MTRIKPVGESPVKEAASEELVTFTPAVGFTGYPAGVKTQFTVGTESAPVPASFLKMVRAKGFVREPEQLVTEGK